MKKQIATIGFKIAGVYLFLASITQIIRFSSGHFFLAQGSFGPDEPIGLFVGTLIVFGISILTWRYADVLPERLLGIEEQNLNKRRIAVLSIRIIGL